MKLLLERIDHFYVKDELIVFLPKHQQYFGIEGAARLIVEVFLKNQTPMCEDQVVEQLLLDPQSNTDERLLIHEGILSLHQLGILHDT